MTDQLIAVVNDDETYIKLMDDLLTEEGYKTILCISSGLAYEIVKRNKPDLMILDIRMERAESGWTVLDLIRLDPDTAKLPVIVCSADSQFLRSKADLLRQKRCAVLEKPFELNDLLAKVREAAGPPRPEAPQPPMPSSE